MKIAIAKMILRSGTKQVIWRRFDAKIDRGFPLIFEDVPELSGLAWDCRILRDGGSDLRAGENGLDLRVAFLSPEEVLPFLKPGICFTIFPDVGVGEIVDVPERDFASIDEAAKAHIG